MRRDRIVKAVHNLKEALLAAQIRDLLRIARAAQTPEGSARTQRILLAYNVFTQHYKGFSEDEKQLMTFFSLDPLLDVAFWSGLIEGEPAMSRKLLSEVDVGAYNIIFVMPKLRELLTREDDRNSLFITDASGAEHELLRVRIFLAEKERALTEPSTVINIVHAMTELYDSLAALSTANGVGLTIGAIDSDGAKTFDFFGAVRVMESLDQLLVSVWNRIKHHAEDNTRYQIEMALMASGFVARLKDAQTARIISEDQGQRLSHAMVKAIETLLRNGAYTENMDEVREVRASQFLAPKTHPVEFKDGTRASHKREDAGAAADGAESTAAATGGPNGGAYNGGHGGGYGTMDAGPIAPEATVRSAFGGGGADPLYRSQTPTQRDAREPKEGQRDLKDIFGTPASV